MTMESAENRLRISLAAERDLLVESQEQQQRLDVSLRAALMGTAELDVASGRFVVDDRAEQIIGLPDEQLTLDSLAALVHPDDRRRLVAEVRAAAARGAPYDAVFRLEVGSDAPTRWVHAWGQPIEGEHGEVRKIVGVVQDVTEEREALRLIEEREARLQLVLDVTVTGMFDWDVRGGSISFSDNWFASIGFRPGEIDTDHWEWEAIVHPADWPDTSRLLEAHVDGRDPVFSHELRLRRKDGTWRWARIAARAVERDPTGRARRVIGAETDITDQRRLEQQLLHTAKMQSLGEFAGGIAHDFNNVMAIVRGHTEFLLRACDDDAAGGRDPGGDTVRRLSAIEHAVGRASSLVRELMLLGRPATDNPVVVDLADHVRTSTSAWPALLGDDIALVVDVGDDGDDSDDDDVEGVYVRIDPSRLDALLLNVVANSRDAMVNGGTIRVTVRRGVDVDGVARALIEMSDDGVGMDEATVASIFDPFFTTKAPGVGTGLGLATSFTTVTQAGGTIAARSQPGAGTTIVITLPLAVFADPVSTPAPSNVVEGGRVGSILVVEDEAEILQLNADILRLAGHRVYEALDGAESIEILEDRVDIDLVLTDVVMPGMSGPQLAAIVRERWPRVRILYLSGHAATAPAIEGIDRSQLLTKPIGADELVAAVAQAMRRDHRPQRLDRGTTG